MYFIFLPLTSIAYALTGKVNSIHDALIEAGEEDGSIFFFFLSEKKKFFL